MLELQHIHLTFIAIITPSQLRSEFQFYMEILTFLNAKLSARIKSNTIKVNFSFDLAH